MKGVAILKLENRFKLFPNEHYMDMTLFQYGMEQCPPGHSYGPAARNHYLFHYILSGKGVLNSTGSNSETHTYHLSAGSGFLIFPEQITTYIADSDNPWAYCWLEFDGLKCKDILTAAGITYDEPIYHPLNNESRDILRDEMLSIVNNEDKSSLYLIGHLYLFMDALINSSFNHSALTGGHLKDLYIREATAFVEQNYHHYSITVKDMADFCNLNQNYLAKIFKETLHQTPQQFLIYYRMNKAAELLRYTNIPISELSRQVGYQSQLNFSRAFKNLYGVSPQNWRKEHRVIDGNGPKKK